MLLGGPLFTLCLVLLAQVRPRGERRGATLTLTGIELRLYGLVVALTAFACLAVLLTYLVGENVTDAIVANS